jgi:hypothetical protein
MSRHKIGTAFWVQLVLGVFFTALGLVALIYNRYGMDGGGVGRLFSRGGDTLNVIFAIVELAGGVILLLGLFVAMSGRVPYVAALVLLVLWLVRVLDCYFLSGIFEPNFLIWLTGFSRSLIPAAALWIVARGMG